ncbi:MAG: hypothetical protein OXN89_07715 [Bryobacterales bacterium]|nr:hypothetical protein [Bryobacterales bacterium]
MNVVEPFLAELTEDRIRAGSFTSVKQLTDTISTLLAERNENQKPYRWKVDGGKVAAKIHRERKALEGS